MAEGAAAQSAIHDYGQGEQDEGGYVLPLTGNGAELS